jgi:hypothetical protein
MDSKIDERYFRTTSLPIATFLFAKGLLIAGINQGTSFKKEVCFVRTDHVDELIEKYKYGDKDDEDLLVSIHVYEHARNELLDQLNER